MNIEVSLDVEVTGEFCFEVDDGLFYHPLWVDGQLLAVLLVQVTSQHYAVVQTGLV